MNIGVLGTGVVGQTIAAKLSELGHQVTIGTRDPAKTLAKKEPNQYGGPPFSEWQKKHQKVKLGTLAEAAKFGETLFLCTNGAGTMDALKLAKPENFKGKTVIDITNPLDFSKGMPPTLLPQWANTNSLAEEIQKTLPEANVVKSLNIVNCEVMVNPKKTGGDPTMFVAGNDERAKEQVKAILKQFGWSDIIDVGDITAARAMEMLVILWARIWIATRNVYFGWKIVR